MLFLLIYLTHSDMLLKGCVMPVVHTSLQHHFFLLSAATVELKCHFARVNGIFCFLKLQKPSSLLLFGFSFSLSSVFHSVIMLFSCFYYCLIYTPLPIRLLGFFSVTGSSVKALPVMVNAVALDCHQCGRHIFTIKGRLLVCGKFLSRHTNTKIWSANALQTFVVPTEEQRQFPSSTVSLLLTHMQHAPTQQLHVNTLADCPSLAGPVPVNDIEPGDHVFFPWLHPHNDLFIQDKGSIYDPTGGESRDGEGEGAHFLWTLLTFFLPFFWLCYCPT